MGQFVESSQKLSITQWGSICLGDLNGDSSIDVFIGNYGKPNEIWLNNGKGKFADTGMRLGDDETTGLSALGDLDSDGDLDLFVALFGEGSNSIWLNERPDIKIKDN